GERDRRQKNLSKFASALGPTKAQPRSHGRRGAERRCISISLAGTVFFRLERQWWLSGGARGEPTRGRRSKELLHGGTSEPAPPSAADAKAKGGRGRSAGHIRPRPAGEKSLRSCPRDDRQQRSPPEFFAHRSTQRRPFA